MDYAKDFESRFLDIALGRIHYMYHKGTGKNLIFLHGMGASGLSWKRLVEQLPGYYTVYLIDLFGQGQSSAPQMDYTVDAQVIMLVQFIENLAIENPCLIGHSYGGWIAASYAAQFRSGGLVLEDSAGTPDSFDRLAKSGKEDEYRKYFMQEAMKINNNKDYVIRSMLDEGFKRKFELTPKLLAGIVVPTLIIWGSKDPIEGVSGADALKKGIKHSAVRIIDGAGHVPHVSHTKEVADAIQTFLTSF